MIVFQKRINRLTTTSDVNSHCGKQEQDHSYPYMRCSEKYQMKKLSNLA